jgi:triacylglycerol lipase
MLGVEGLRACGRMWAGGLEPNDPKVSPLYGQLAGLPATTVYAGSRDVLYPDALRLQERARTEGLDIKFVLENGLLHAWAAFWFLPEARAARPSMLRTLLGGSWSIERARNEAHSVPPRRPPAPWQPE